MRTINRTLPKTLRYYLLPTALFIAIVAANIYVYRQSPYIKSPANNVALSSPEKVQASTLPADVISVDNVKDLVAKEAPGETVSTVRLHSQDDRSVFIVELTNKLVLAFDAKTGQKLAKTVLTKAEEVVETILPGNNKTTIELENNHTEDPAPETETPAEDSQPTEQQNDSTNESSPLNLQETLPSLLGGQSES